MLYFVVFYNDLWRVPVQLTPVIDLEDFITFEFSIMSVKSFIMIKNNSRPRIEP